MKELTIKDIANIVYDAIEDQRIISREKVAPVIEAVMKAFIKTNDKSVIINKKVDHYVAKINEENACRVYWQRAVQRLDPDNLKAHYEEINKIEAEHRAKQQR